MIDLLRKAWQRYKGCPPHDWFPDLDRREFLPMTATCLRCTATRVRLPWGQCLGGGGHPIEDHFNERGQHVLVPRCPEGPL